MPATAQIRIGADTKQFQKAMQEVQKGMGVLQRQVVKNKWYYKQIIEFPFQGRKVWYYCWYSSRFSDCHKSLY